MENNIFPFGQGKKASKVPGQYDDVLPLFFFFVTRQIKEMNRCIFEDKREDHVSLV